MKKICQMELTSPEGCAIFIEKCSLYRTTECERSPKSVDYYVYFVLELSTYTFVFLIKNNAKVRRNYERNRRHFSQQWRACFSGT